MPAIQPEQVQASWESLLHSASFWSFIILILLVIGVIFWASHRARWVRIRAALALGIAPFAYPAFKIVIEHLGTVEVPGQDWAAVLGAYTLALAFVALELNFQRDEAGARLLGEFQLVMKELSSGKSATEIASTLGIPISRAEAIVACMIFMEHNLGE